MTQNRGEWSTAELCWTRLAPRPCSTPSAPWLQLLCPVSCVHVPVLVRTYPLHRMRLTAAVPTSAGVSGVRLTSLLKPLQRDPGWAGEVRGAVLGRTAAASLGFGSWEAGTAVEVGGGVGVARRGGSRRGMCVAGGQRQEAWE